jgi:hypothetical protein
MGMTYRTRVLVALTASMVLAAGLAASAAIATAEPPYRGGLPPGDVIASEAWPEQPMHFEQTTLVSPTDPNETQVERFWLEGESWSQWRQWSTGDGAMRCLELRDSNLSGGCGWAASQPPTQAANDHLAVEVGSSGVFGITVALRPFAGVSPEESTYANDLGDLESLVGAGWLDAMTGLVTSRLVHTVRESPVACEGSIAVWCDDGEAIQSTIVVLDERSFIPVFYRSSIDGVLINETRRIE